MLLRAHIFETSLLCKWLFLFLLSIFFVYEDASARFLESPYSQEVVATPGADNEPPVTNVTIGRPQYGDREKLYISGVTPISLSAVDYGVVPSGLDYTEYGFNGTSWTRYADAFTLSGYMDGPHTIYYRSKDKVGNIETSKSTSLILDKTAPLTTASVTGTAGSNGWHVSDVKVELGSVDGGSGVETIKYGINGVEDTAVSGTGASFVLSTDGRYIVKYHAADHLGNIEREKSLEISIDKTPPTVMVTAAPNALWPPNHKIIDVWVEGAASDETSGIASVVITVTDEYGKYNHTVTGFGNTIRLEAWREGADSDGRVYTITAVAVDKAGNRATSTTTVIVPHDMSK